MSGNMRASYQPGRASSRRRESPFSWGFLGILVLALELLLPTCSGQSFCPQPPKFQTMKTKLDFGGPVIAGFPIEYECLRGYKPKVVMQTIMTYCQSDGSYKPELQEGCTIMSCPKLTDPVHGNVFYDNGTTTFDTQVHFTCDEGYHLVGAKIRKCVVAGYAVRWTASSPKCEEIYCDPPITIPNGDFTNSHKERFEYNETVIYTCNPSTETDIYTLVGESTLVCIGPDEWSSEAPDCKVTYTDEPRNRADELDGGLIAVIVLTVFVGVAVVDICV